MRILLVQTAFLGDVVLSTPVIAALKELHPKSEIWMMTTPAGKALVEHDPLLEGVVVFDKRKGDAGPFGLLRKAREIEAMGFDRAYALQRSVRTTLLLALAKIPFRCGFRSARMSRLYHVRAERPTGLHDVERNLSLLSAEGSIAGFSGEMRLFPQSTPPANPIAADLVRRQKPYVVMVPASAWHTKMWHWAGYREAARILSESGIDVVVVGAPGEEAVAEKVSQGLHVTNLAGRVTLAETMTLVRKSACVVCNDSMALQMSSALKVPNVAVFCATSPSFGFGPWRNRAIVVQRDDLPCKPCSRHGTRKCPLGTEACMRGVHHNSVVRAVRALLTERDETRAPADAVHEGVSGSEGRTKSARDGARSKRGAKKAKG